MENLPLPTIFTGVVLLGAELSGQQVAQLTLAEADATSVLALSRVRQNFAVVVVVQQVEHHISHLSIRVVPRSIAQIPQLKLQRANLTQNGWVVVELRLAGPHVDAA